MCDPVTASIALAVTTVVGTGAQLAVQASAAKKQEAQIRSQQAVVAEENRVEASSELFDQMRAARREQAKIRTAAGEAGLGLNSGSIEGLLMDSAMQMELQGSRTLANMESRHAANTADAESMLSQVQKPTLLGAGLQLAGAAASGWSAVGNAKIAKANASLPKVGT
jgi:hypothetical protein